MAVRRTAEVSYDRAVTAAKETCIAHERQVIAFHDKRQGEGGRPEHSFVVLSHGLHEGSVVFGRRRGLCFAEVMEVSLSLLFEMRRHRGLWRVRSRHGCCFSTDLPGEFS